MGWRFVIQPNGLIARFSEVVDNFTDYDMTEAEAVAAAILEYDCGLRTALEKVERAKTNPNRWEESLKIIKNIHGNKEVEKLSDEMKLKLKKESSDAKP